MQKIPRYCKFNVLLILLKIAAMSAWDFKFEISCFLCLETFEVLSRSFIEHSLWRGFTNQNEYLCSRKVEHSCKPIHLYDGEN